MPFSDFQPQGSKTPAGGYLPRIQCDARTGFLAKVNRVQVNDEGHWKSVPAPLPYPLALQIDFANLEVIWASFQNGPSIHAVRYRDLVDGTAQMIDRPSEDHKPGFRVRVYNASLLEGGVHEFSSTANCVRSAMDKIHDAFEAQAANHLDQAPIVTFSGVSPAPSAKGMNYFPIMEITGWKSRDPFDDLPANAKASPTAVAAPAPAQVTPPPPPHNASATPEFS